MQLTSGNRNQAKHHLQCHQEMQHELVSVSPGATCRGAFSPSSERGHQHISPVTAHSASAVETETHSSCHNGSHPQYYRDDTDISKAQGSYLDLEAVDADQNIITEK